MNLPVITGLGLITPLGGNCEETFEALLAGKFITSDSRAKFASGQGGNVNELALAAAREAMRQAEWREWPEDAAIIIGTSKGDIESWLVAIDQIQCCRPAEYRWGNRLGLGDLAAYLAKELNARNSVRLTYSAACASGLHALARAVMMIQFSEARRVLVIAAESSLHPLFQGCFDRLGVLAREGEPCRPFDVNRRGFHISQCAAAICLESSQITQGRALAAIENIALAGDAFHITGTDPSSIALMRLLKSMVASEPFELIHAHGTGTISNDSAELAAIASIIDSSAPYPNVYSHKAALGHSLGASGLVSLVSSCLMHQHGKIPPNICTVERAVHKQVVIDLNATKRAIQRSIVISSGFGGAMAVASLRSI